jgi:hypothetical protein
MQACQSACKNKPVGGSSEKGKENKVLYDKNNVILKFFSCFNLSAVFKNTFLFNKTRVFVENCKN